MEQHSTGGAGAEAHRGRRVRQLVEGQPGSTGAIRVLDLEIHRDQPFGIRPSPLDLGVKPALDRRLGIGRLLTELRPVADGKERTIRYIAATTYWSHDGRPITAQEFMAQLFGDLGALVASEDELRAIWSDPERREGFLQRLAELSYGGDRMDDLRRLFDAPNSDIFDVLAYVRFTLAPLARKQRADAARSTGLRGYEAEMRQFLDYVLQAYEVRGVEELSVRKIGDFLRIRYGGTGDAKAALGPMPDIRQAFVEIQRHLFR